MALAPIDLNPYGLSWTLDPTRNVVVPPDYKTAIVSKSMLSNKIKFTKPDGTDISIALNKTILASGSYGSTFTTDTELEPGIKLVVKLIARSDQFTTVDVITETIVNIILYEVSKDVSYPEVAGPFVPKVYLFGKDDKYYYLVLERLETKWLDDIKATRNPQDLVDPLLQVTQILKTLYERVRFNHRDFKPDNIMYKTVAGIKQFRLIDFGMSCLNYGKIHVEPTNAYITSENGLRTCFSPSRDLSALMLYLVNYTSLGQRACGLMRIFKILLLDEVKAPHPEGNTAWANSYKFYNRSTPNINVNPDTVYNIFKDLKYEKPSNPCSDVIGDWTRNLKYITYAMTKHLTDEELFYVPKPALLDLLLNKISATSAMGSQLIKRVYDLAQKIGETQVTNAINKSRGVKLAGLAKAPNRPPLPQSMPPPKNLSQARRGIAIPALPLPGPGPAPTGQHLGRSLPPLRSQTPQSDEFRLLSLAASARDFPQMKQLIAQPGLDLTYTDEYGRNILHYLARYESAEILDLVFAKNSSSAFINAEDRTAVCPLSITIKNKIYANTARFLDQLNIDVFHKASYSQNNILTQLIQDKQAELVSKVFAINNSAEFVNYEDSTGLAPISYALEVEDETIISLIIKQLNFRAPKSILYDLDGIKTPRILGKILSIVELYEPDYLNYVDPSSGNTPLIAACRKGNLIVVKALLKSPFILTAIKNMRGETALHAAAEFCRDNYDPNLKEEELFETAGGQIIRLLLVKNSVLPNIPAQSGTKPSGEEYSGRGPLKRFLKMQKSTVFKRHINTNINTRKAIIDHAKNPLKLYENPMLKVPSGGRKTRRRAYK